MRTIAQQYLIRMLEEFVYLSELGRRPTPLQTWDSIPKEFDQGTLII
jgi:hypothetical protein